MQIPRALLRNLTAGVNGLTESAQAGLSEALQLFEFTGDVALDRSRLVAIMSSVLRPYVSNAVSLSRSFYNILRRWAVGSELDVPVSVDDVYDSAATEQAVRAFMQKAVEGKHEQIAGLLMERIDYEMKLASANTAYEMGRRDSLRVKFARVPDGAETCEFCLALAGLGFQYRSEQSASVHIHKGCDCRIVPKFGNESVDGYDPHDYRDQFRQSVQDRADKAGISYDEAYEARYGTEARTRRAGNRKHK